MGLRLEDLTDEEIERVAYNENNVLALEVIRRWEEEVETLRAEVEELEKEG